MPSKITEEISPLLARNASSSACSSFSGTKITLSVWLTGATMFGLSVAATANEVRPWNEPFIAITFFLPLKNEASFSAFSFASAPELHRNNW